MIHLADVLGQTNETIVIKIRTIFAEGKGWEELSRKGHKVTF